MPTITLREITADTLRPILKLEVAENQRGFVAPNAVSVAEAYFHRDHAWFRGIYADDTPVGFVMLYIDTDKAQYHVWRYMIDQRFQKHGYAYRAMELVIEHVRSLPNAKELSLSFVPGDGDPSGFYAKLGFELTDEWEEGERVMRLRL
ncbi:GNAT family N-acetyltransferase [candidate division GN15 bacterium]|nr:GNAT family N-acetyltransferase [candidate division GN15 bacterium]